MRRRDDGKTGGHSLNDRPRDTLLGGDAGRDTGVSENIRVAVVLDQRSLGVWNVAQESHAGLPSVGVNQRLKPHAERAVADEGDPKVMLSPLFDAPESL